MADWHYKIGEQVVGPLSADQLKALADEGRLAPNDPVAKSPEGPWVAASRVKGLFEIAAIDDEPEEESTPSVPGASKAPPVVQAATDIGEPSVQEPPIPQPPVVMPPQTPSQTPSPQAAPPLVEASPSGGFGIQTEQVAVTQRLQRRKREKKPKEPKAPLTKKQKNVRLVKWLAIGIVLGIVVLVCIPMIRRMVRPAPEVAAEKNPIVADVDLAGADDGLEGAFDSSSRAASPRPGSTTAQRAPGESADGPLGAMDEGLQSRNVVPVVEARPVRVVLDQPRMSRPDGSGTGLPPNLLLLVYMELKTKSGDTTARFRGWANNADDISLTDSRGNEYAVRTPQSFGGRFVDGQCREMVFVSADDPATDVIVFAWPEKDAPVLPSNSEEELLLRLPKSVYGEEGNLLFAIPLSQIDVTEEAIKQSGGLKPATSDNVMEDDGGPIKIPGLMN